MLVCLIAVSTHCSFRPLLQSCRSAIETHKEAGRWIVRPGGIAHYKDRRDPGDMPLQNSGSSPCPCRAERWGGGEDGSFEGGRPNAWKPNSTMLDFYEVREQIRLFSTVPPRQAKFPEGRLWWDDCVIVVFTTRATTLWMVLLGLQKTLTFVSNRASIKWV